MPRPPRHHRHSRAPRLAVAASAAAVTASLGPQPAQSQTFAPPVINPFGLLGVGGEARPTFADIDGDGDLDAFIGDVWGNANFFENVGSPTDPAFADPQANPFGLSARVAFNWPTFADIDGDGDLDAFIWGNYRPYYGDTRFYENTGTVSSPLFKAGDLPYGFGLGTLGDIDADGDLDLFHVVADVWFGENIGTATDPVFPLFPEKNPWGIVPPASSLTSLAPALADIDGDGDLDLFTVGFQPVNESTSNSYVYFFENAGTPISPEFAALERDPFDLIDLDAFHVAFADVDSDGDLDAFIGQVSGNTAFFENATTSVSVEPPGESVGAHALSAAYPNPFRERTRFRLEVSEAQPVRVEVYDALGRMVEVPFDRVVSAGASQDVVCNMESWPAGVYVVRAHGPRFEATRTVVKQQ